jgi:hypothetical protein
LATGGTITLVFVAKANLVADDFRFDSTDFDGDNDTDGHDFLTWQRGFGITAPNATEADGDADGDLDVDGDDLTLWSAQYGPASLMAAATLPTVSLESAGPISAAQRTPRQSNEKIARIAALDVVLTQLPSAAADTALYDRRSAQAQVSDGPTNEPAANTEERDLLFDELGEF